MQAFGEGHWGSNECRGGNGILSACSKKMSQEAADDEGLNQGSSDRGAVMETAGRRGLGGRYPAGQDSVVHRMGVWGKGSKGEAV